MWQYVTDERRRDVERGWGLYQQKVKPWWVPLAEFSLTWAAWVGGVVAVAAGAFLAVRFVALLHNLIL